MRIDLSDDARAARAVEADAVRLERRKAARPVAVKPVAVKPAKPVAAKPARTVRAKHAKPPGPGRGGARPGSGRKPLWSSPAALEAKAMGHMDAARMMFTRAAELRHGHVSPNVSVPPTQATVSGATASA